ncbi:hypothetical protein Ancab_012671 [Ancistrocladus abbreviatus]
MQTLQAFGKRLLKTWLARPLHHTGSIKARQDAMSGLRITYVTIGKESYLLAMPKHLHACVPRDCELRSSKKVTLAIRVEGAKFLRSGHPVLRSDSLGKGAFVPNDILIGCSDHASFILLTGPNMGGKSTFLRQVCLAVIFGPGWSRFACVTVQAVTSAAESLSGWGQRIALWKTSVHF